MVRFLKRLVTGLTVTMIAGVLIVIALLVTQITRAPAPLALPESVALPEGATLKAFTVTDDWWIVVTGNGQILVHDRASGALLTEISVTAPR